MNVINQLLSEFVRVIPNIVGAILVLLVGWLVAKILQAVTRGGLRRAGLDRFLTNSTAGPTIGRLMKSPAMVVSRIVYWLVWLGALSLAVSVLGISALTAFVAAIYSYLPNVLAAILILLVAVAVSAAVSGLVSRLMGDTPTGKLVASITPGLIFSVAIFMVLEQLGIAPAIVIITYAAILGSVTLAAALAFGLGGRDFAANLLDQAQRRTREQVGQARQDLATGRARGEAMAREADRLQGRDAGAQESGSVGFTPAPEFGERISERRTKRPPDASVDGVIPIDDELDDREL